MVYIPDVLRPVEKCDYAKACDEFPQYVPYDAPNVPPQFIYKIALRNMSCGYVHLGLAQLKTFKSDPYNFYQCAGGMDMKNKMNKFGYIILPDYSSDMV